MDTLGGATPENTQGDTIQKTPSKGPTTGYTFKWFQDGTLRCDTIQWTPTRGPSSVHSQLDFFQASPQCTPSKETLQVTSANPGDTSLRNFPGGFIQGPSPGDLPKGPLPEVPLQGTPRRDPIQWTPPGTTPRGSERNLSRESLRRPPWDHLQSTTKPTGTLSRLPILGETLQDTPPGEQLRRTPPRAQFKCTLQGKPSTGPSTGDSLQVPGPAARSNGPPLEELSRGPFQWTILRDPSRGQK